MAYEVPLPGGYLLSDDVERIDLGLVHRCLSEESYWARGRADPAITARSFRNSIAIGVHAPDGALAGFARILSDRATSAHLADVFILPGHRGRGLGTGLVAAVLAHPELATCRRWTLVTRDAHALYARFGFGPPPDPRIQMTLHLPQNAVPPAGTSRGG